MRANAGDEKRELLIVTCRRVQSEYLKLRERKGVLVEGISVMEDVGRYLYRYVNLKSLTILVSSISFPPVLLLLVVPCERTARTRADKPIVL